MTYNAKLKSSPHCRQKVVGESQHAVWTASENGWSTKWQIKSLVIDRLTKHNVRSSVRDYECVNCVSWSGCGCVSSVCLYCWVTGSASKSPAERTRQAKRGTTHLRITLVTRGPCQLVFWLYHCFLKPTWLSKLMTTGFLFSTCNVMCINHSHIFTLLLECS